jgi:hypothetical protein
VQTTGPLGGRLLSLSSREGSQFVARPAFAQPVRNWHGSRPGRTHAAIDPLAKRIIQVLEANSFRSHSAFHPGTQPVSPAPSPAPADGRDAWIARLRQLGVEAAAGSDRFNAALMLVASVDIGPNVERLSRRTGVPRPFASRCGRRLVDNGVWTGGCTVGDWVADPTLPFASEAFLQDVGVAEGRLLRRVGSGGSFEWAPIGHWSKSFDGTEDDDAPATTWVDAAPQPGDVRALAEEREDPARRPVPEPRPADSTTSAGRPDAAASAEKPDSTAPAAQPPEASAPTAEASTPAPSTNGTAPPARPASLPDRDDSSWIGTEATAETDAAGSDESAPSLEDVFSGAVWLR